jgi:hypothetical protein
LKTVCFFGGGDYVPRDTRRESRLFLWRIVMIRNKLTQKQGYALLLFSQKNQDAMSKMSSTDASKFASDGLGFDVTICNLASLKQDTGIECYISGKHSSQRGINAEKLEVVAKCLRDLYRHLGEEVPDDLLKVSKQV